MLRQRRRRVVLSTLQWEVLSRRHFTTREQARAVVIAWAQEFYNTRRRHSSANMLPPRSYEAAASGTRQAA